MNKPAASTTNAILHLNGKPVGSIDVNGCSDSWHFGRFMPDAAFAEFAPLFGRWSLLIHADLTDERLSAEASDELRRVEYEIDGLRAQLFFPGRNQPVCIAQLNIDGPMIEWKTVAAPVL